MHAFILAHEYLDSTFVYSDRGRADDAKAICIYGADKAGDSWSRENKRGNSEEENARRAEFSPLTYLSRQLRLRAS